MQHRLIWVVLSLASVMPAFGSPIVNLGTASTFGMLGGTISNTGASTVLGNVGATTTITGFPPGTATGTVYPFPSDPTVTLAYNDFISAFNLALLDPSTQSFSGLTTSQTFLGNNVYTSPLTDVVSTAGINLTFDAQADSTEVFLIRITRDLTINGPINFTLQNGAKASNIFWIVGRTETINPVGVPVTWDGEFSPERVSRCPLLVLVRRLGARSMGVYSRRLRIRSRVTRRWWLRGLGSGGPRAGALRAGGPQWSAGPGDVAKISF